MVRDTAASQYEAFVLDPNTRTERTIERDHYSKLGHINKLYRIAKNKYSILTDKGKTQKLEMELTE